MCGFAPDHVDPYNSIPVRVFKVLARESLPTLSVSIEMRAAGAFNELFESGRKCQAEGCSKIAPLMLS